MPEVVEFLWKQAANITPVSGSDLQVGERGPESTDSEKEREREMVEPAEREEERLELGPREVWKSVGLFVLISLRLFFPTKLIITTCLCVTAGPERFGGTGNV